MRFRDVIGQEEVKKRLIKTVSVNRVSHAQLFLGPSGSGKLALAIAYAQFLNCKNRTETDSCGVCSSCTKFEKLAHPDLHFIFPVTTTKAVKKDPVSKDFMIQWREFVLEKKGYIDLYGWHDKIGVENKQGIINADDCNEIIKTLGLKAYEANYKIMIIWMAERIYYSAAPKILKILEEPPEKTLFLLVSEDQDNIINTILSRTQLVKIPKLKDIDLLDQLVNTLKLKTEEAKSIVHEAEGDLISAIQLAARREEVGQDLERLRNWMLMCYFNKVPEIIDFVNQISRTGRERQKQFLGYSLATLRRAFMHRFGEGEKVTLNKDEHEFVSKFNRFLDPEKLSRIYREFNDAIFHIERNGNPNLVFLDLSLKTRDILFAERK